jgi:peptide/nickel transport system substrate-binding protein
MALDRKAMVESVLGGEAVVAESPILPGNWAFDALVRMPAYDPEGTAVLLDEEGWVVPAEDGTRARDGLPFSFRRTVSNEPEFEQLARLAAGSWAEVGVDVQVDVMDPTAMRDQRLLPRNFDAALVEFGQGGVADPDPYPFWHQSQIEAGQNISGFDDRDVSEALETARRDLNGVRRAELYREFQRLFAERGAAVLLYYPTYTYAVDCRVAGVQPSMMTGPSDRFREVGQWRWLPAGEAENRCGA